MLLYVDDILTVGSNKLEIKRLKIQLGGEFEMKDMGAARKMLGVDILRKRKEKSLVLSQKELSAEGTR